jgi:hypothetical protein
LRILLLVIKSMLMMACAGPNNPFGSKVWINSEFKHQIESADYATIKSFPENKVYHKPFDMIIQIADENGVPKNFRYQVLYNGEVIDSWWKTEKIAFDKENPNIVNIVFSDLSLLPERENKIDILYYRNAASKPVVYSIKPPSCSFEDALRIGSLDPFEDRAPVGKSFLENISLDYRLNPPLLAALVAQESSFNPQAVSWAKAIGLTQVTPIANQEVITYKNHWPVDERINHMNYLQIKARILAGKINEETDWRLDKHKSIEGGIIYLKELKKYWTKKSSIKLLNQTFNRDIPWTDILLASYNSGAYRVKKSIKRNKRSWLQDQELKEAKKYVKNIKSYCHAFSDLNTDLKNINQSQTIVKN